MLGLNAGVRYDDLQSFQGIWAQRIREQGYSHCVHHSPAEDADSWIALHGKPSFYWAKLTKVTQRWLQDPAAGAADIVNFESYPWHSTKVSGHMNPPAGVISQFVQEPVQELDVPVVFAFGAAWFDIVAGLGLPLVARFGSGGQAFPGPVRGDWNLGAYRLPSGHAVVSSQQGYAGPPREERTELMRPILTNLTRQRTDRPAPNAARTQLGVSHWSQY